MTPTLFVNTNPHRKIDRPRLCAKVLVLTALANPLASAPSAADLPVRIGVFRTGSYGQRSVLGKGLRTRLILDPQLPRSILLQPTIANAAETVRRESR
jgi:hypothetical protein